MHLSIMRHFYFVFLNTLEFSYSPTYAYRTTQHDGRACVASNDSSTSTMSPTHLCTCSYNIPLRTTAYHKRQKCGASISYVLLRRIQGLVFLLTPDADISLSGSDTLYADTLYPAIGEVGLDSLPGVRMCVCNDASVYVRTYTSHVTTLLQGGDYVVGGIVPGL